MGTGSWILLGSCALFCLGGLGQLMNGPNRGKGFSSFGVGALGVAAVLYFSWGSAADPQPQQVQLASAGTETSVKAARPLPSAMLPVGSLAEGRPWSTPGASTASGATVTPAQATPPQGADLGLTLDQVEARFQAAARKLKTPERLAELECSTAGVPTCVYLVRTEGGSLSTRLGVVAEAKPSRRVTKLSLTFVNEDVNQREVLEAMMVFGGFLVMLSPQLEVKERGELLKALVEGFHEEGEQARTIGGITYRLTSASGAKGMIFSAERGEH